MRMLRYKFYRIEIAKEDKPETRHYLGHLDVVDSGILPDGCSTMAKAFRQASAEQKTANAVEVQEL